MRLKSRCQQDQFSLGFLGRTPFLAFSSFKKPPAFVGMRLCHPDLCIHGHPPWPWPSCLRLIRGFVFALGPSGYSGLENSTDCIVHGVAKSWTRLSNFHFLSHFLSMCNFKVLDWPKSSFGFFHNGNTIISFFHNECSGQPNIRL